MTTRNNRLQFITSLRGIACIIIVFHHLFLNFFSRDFRLSYLWPYFPEFTVDNSHLVQPYINSFLSSFSYAGGAFGVSLFFLITGFTALMSLNSDSSYNYLIKRFFRIYPTYVIGFSITILSIFLFCIYRGVPYPYTIKDYLCHISLFRNWLWSPYIDNGVWTLEMNIDFYIFIFLLYRIFKNRDQKLLNISSVVLCILQIVLYYIALNYVIVGTTLWCKLNVITTLCPYIIFQLIGSTIYNHYINNISTSKLCTSIALMIGVFVTVAYFSYVTTLNIPSYIYGLFVFLLFYVSNENVFKSKIIDFISSISYPLYIIHALIGYILLTIMYQHNVHPYLSFVITVSIVIFLSYLVHITVESYSTKLCKIILSLTKKDA